MAHEHTESLMRYLWRPMRMTEKEEPSALHVILDAARSEEIYPKLKASNADFCCLFKGNIPDVLAKAAPYLVRLNRYSQFTEWVIRSGWGASWGIFFESPATVENLRRHFRQFLMASLPGGKRYYFRFYDPRVWRMYLPTCDNNELENLFGPVQRYCVEGKQARTLIEYSLNYSQLTLSEIDLHNNVFGNVGEK